MKNILAELVNIDENQWRAIGRDLDAGKSFQEINTAVATTLQNLTTVSSSLRNTWGNKKRQR